MTKKNSAAIELNKIRWKKVAKKDRAAHARAMGLASAAALTPAERTARTKKAAKARKQ